MIKLKAISDNKKTLTTGKTYDIYKIYVVSTQGPRVLLVDDTGAWVSLDINLFKPVG